MPSSHDAPPVTLDCPLEVGPDDWRAPGFYQLLTALVVPRPIGWISTISESGERNSKLDRGTKRGDRQEGFVIEILHPIRTGVEPCGLPTRAAP